MCVSCVREQEDIRTAILTMNTQLLNTDKLLALKMMLPSPVHTCVYSPVHTCVYKDVALACTYMCMYVQDEEKKSRWRTSRGIKKKDIKRSKNNLKKNVHGSTGRGEDVAGVRQEE